MFVLVQKGIKAISKKSWNPFYHGSVQVCKKVKERFHEDCIFNQKGKQNVHRMCNLKEREREGGGEFDTRLFSTCAYVNNGM